MGKSRRKAENAALRDGVQKYIQEEAYNTQLVGATSSHFVDCLHSKLREGVDELFDAIKPASVNIQTARHWECFSRQLCSSDQKTTASTEVKADIYDKIDEAFNRLHRFTHDKYFHVPDHVILPEDTCHIQSSTSTASTNLSDVRKIYSQVLEEKQTCSHLDDRLAELHALHDHLTSVKDSVDQINKSI